jgi:hypothetical protein
LGAERKSGVSQIRYVVGVDFQSVLPPETRRGFSAVRGVDHMNDSLLYAYYGFANPRPARNFLPELTRAVCEEYKSDPSAPSIIISYVEKAGSNVERTGFYASVIRYYARYGQERRMVCCVSGFDTDVAAVEALAKKWLDLLPRTALTFKERLQRAVST